MKILFVCEGNVGRSQMAEAIFSSLADTLHSVSSVGTRVIKEDDHSRVGKKLKGTSGAENVLAALSKIGIDASDQTRTQISEDAIKWADIVVIMTGRDTVPEYAIRGDKAVYWEVPDPYQQSLERTEEIRDQINRLVSEFIVEHRLRSEV